MEKVEEEGIQVEGEVAIGTKEINAEGIERLQ